MSHLEDLEGQGVSPHLISKHESLLKATFPKKDLKFWAMAMIQCITPLTKDTYPIFCLGLCQGIHIRQWTPGSCHFRPPQLTIPQMVDLRSIKLLMDMRIHLPRKEILYALVSGNVTENTGIDAISRWRLFLFRELSACPTYWKSGHGGSSTTGPALSAH